MNRPFKDYVLVIILLTCGGYALFYQLQIVVIACLIFISFVFYKSQVKAIYDFLKGILVKARQAEIGNLKIELSDSLEKLTYFATQKSIGIQLVLSKLNEEQISLLLAIYHEGKSEAKNKDSLRVLRNYGLIEHDSEKLSNSSIVWLKPFGKELSKILLGLQEEHLTSGSSCGLAATPLGV